MNKPRLVVDLVKFRLIRSDGNTGTVEDDETRAGGTLVNGTDEPALEEIIALTVFFLYDGAIAIAGLGGVDFRMRLQFIGSGDDAASHFAGPILSTSSRCFGIQQRIQQVEDVAAAVEGGEWSAVDVGCLG